jgi:cell division transport system permease protein
MNISFFKNKEKMLGIAESRNGYDLPLTSCTGNKFLMLLISLMTFLSMLMVLTFFLLSTMTNNWSAGLKDQMTIEIPATNVKSEPLNRSDIESRISLITSLLENTPVVISHNVMSEEEIKELVNPWLANLPLVSNMPLPRLISVQLNGATQSDIKSLSKKVTELVGNARLDTHENWLNNLLEFTSILRISSVLLLTLVGLTTIMAIAGAIQSRMSQYNEEIELLHLMGASDRYISNQLQRHSFILALKGGCIGLFFGTACLFMIKLFYPEISTDLLPNFTLNIFHYSLIASLPVLAALIALFTSKETVLRTLAKMP